MVETNRVLRALAVGPAPRMRLDGEVEAEGEGEGEGAEEQPASASVVQSIKTLRVPRPTAPSPSAAPHSPRRRGWSTHAEQLESLQNLMTAAGTAEAASAATSQLVEP